MRNLKRLVKNYLTGKITIKKFAKSIVSLYDDKPNSVREHELFYGIKLKLAEYSNGHWTETELKSELGKL